MFFPKYSLNGSTESSFKFIDTPAHTMTITLTTNKQEDYNFLLYLLLSLFLPHEDEIFVNQTVAQLSPVDGFP